jgi:corrinoid protein of di/trimethylamine methyltransferase
MSLEELFESVKRGDIDKSQELARKLISQGTDPFLAISSLTEVMSEVGEKFSRLEIFLPEMMKSGKAMATAVEVFSLNLKAGESGAKKGKVIIRTVKGDLHEIGKDIVKLMLEANGFEVKDLGYDVDSMNIIKEAQAIGADIIGLSSLMTTTMPHQKEVIDLLRDKGIRDKFKVVIGGAPTTQKWADEIGADLYCYDAGSAPRLMAELLKG